MVINKRYNETRVFHNQVIECLRDMNIRFPYFPPSYFFFLASSSSCASWKNIANDDYNEAIASSNRAITLASDLPKDTEHYRSAVHSSFMRASGLRYSTLCALGFPWLNLPFLSACHTAEQTEDSISDKALHLTIVGSGVLLGRCGQWQMKMGNIWSKISINTVEQ